MNTLPFLLNLTLTLNLNPFVRAGEIKSKITIKIKTGRASGWLNYISTKP